MSKFHVPAVVARHFAYHTPERKLNEKHCRKCTSRLRIGKKDKYCSVCMDNVNDASINKLIEEERGDSTVTTRQIRIKVLDAQCDS